jgi:hypothetical protein
MPTIENPLTLATGLSRDYLLHHRVCPSRVANDGTLIVATAPGALLGALDDIAGVYHRPVRAEEQRPLKSSALSSG